MDNCPDDHRFPAIVEEVADLLAQHKLVPFFGAGISRQHLGVAAAELAQEMAERIGQPPETPLADVSDLYAEGQGEAAFVDYLRRKLVVADLDERKAPSHRLLVSLMQNLLYTTNQDNLFELLASKYGRHYRRVVTIEDLSKAVPGEPLLIKFHGDVDIPESLVFGTKSYQARMQAEDHPLDIKLRADLLGKRLLFLGYSLRDENVAKLFATVKRAHGGNLPSSYLVAFDDDQALMESAREYQVKVIVPRHLFPEMGSNAEAFERFLQLLCNETRRQQVERGVSDLSSEGVFNPRVATDYEVRAARHAIENESFEIALDAFRATFDLTHVPEFMQQDVTDLFAALVARADPENAEQMNALKPALFNFRLPPSFALVATAAVMAACNRRPSVRGFDSFCSLPSPALPDGLMPVAAALAVAMLFDRREAITDGFRKPADSWFRGYEDVGENSKGNVIAMIKAAWPGSLETRSPLHQSFPSFKAKSYHEIVKEMTAMFPKRLDSPKE